MLHKGFKFVLILLAVLYSQAIYPGLGSLPVVKSTSGYVGAVGVVTGADGKPILAEFGSDGLIVRDLPFSAEEVSILPASAYRAMQQLLQTYLTEHGDSGDRLAVGARLMPAAQYKSLNLVTNTAASEPVTRPDLRSDQSRSVLVIDERKILTPNPPYEAVVLMEFPVDLSADETLADTDLSLLIDADGRVVYKSAYDISFKVDFYKDEKATNGFERLWAPVGGMPLFGLYGGAPTFPDGKYHLTEIWPACPGFSYNYKTMITAKVYYSDFNPKNQSGGAHYVPVVKEGFVSCSGRSASLLSTPTLGAQMTGLAMQGIEASARSANIVGDQDFNIPVVQLYAFAQLENVELGDKTEYYSDDAAIPLKSPGDYQFDFDGDGEDDLIVANPADSGKVDIYLAGRTEFDDLGNRNPPDLTRLADYVFTPQLLRQGLLKTISKEDLEDTDVYVYRESTGQLLSSVEGLAGEGGDKFIGDGGNVGSGPEAGFNYSTLIVSAGDPGRFLGESSLFDRSIDRRPWAPSAEGSSGFPDREPDFLRVGEVVRVIAINRKTGYLGSTRIRLASLYSELEQTTANDMVLLPPNIKVIATRDFDVEAGLTKDEKRLQLIGSEGAGLTSDNYVKIQTVWLDEDGSVLPEDLPGYTGRLAISTGNATDDFSGNFEIKPGYQTQVVQLNNAADLTTEHFYVQLTGEHINGNPSFASPGAGPGKLQTRPAQYVPVLVPIFNETATYDAQQALKQARQDGIQGLPDSVDPIYHWVYRPEMQFSVYDMRVNAIRQEIAANEFNDIYPAGADNDPATVPAISPDYDITQILYELTGKSDNFDLQRFGPERELILSIGEQEANVTATVNEQGQLTFDNVDHISLLDMEDFVSIRLYQNNDTANVLWEFAFEYLALYTTEDFEEFDGNESNIYVEANSLDDLEVELAAELVGYYSRPDDQKEARTVRWRVEGDGSIEHTSTTDSETGIFVNKVVMQPAHGSTATVYVTVANTNPPVESRLGEIVVLAGTPANVVVTTSGQAYSRGAGNAVATVTATDAYGNNVLAGTPVAYTVEGDSYLDSPAGLMSEITQFPLRGGTSSGHNTLTVQVGAVTAQTTFTVNPLTTEIVTAPTTAEINTMHSITVRATAGGLPASGIFVDVGSDRGRLQYTSLETDINGEIALNLHTGNDTGPLTLMARTDTGSQDMHIVNVTNTGPIVGVSVSTNTPLIVADTTATSVDTLGYDSTSVNFPYNTNSNLTVTGAPSSSYTLTLAGRSAPNREPYLRLPLNNVDFLSEQDDTGLNDPVLSSVSSIHDHPAGIGRSAGFNGTTSVITVASRGTQKAANSLLNFAFKPQADGGVLVNHHGAHIFRYNANQVEYELTTSDGVFALTSPLLAENQWHSLSGFVDNGQMHLIVDGLQQSTAITGTLLYSDTRGIIIGERYRGLISSASFYDLDTQPLLLFSNGQESINVTTDAGGQVQTAVTTNTSLNSQYPGSALDQLQVELLVGDDSTAVTLVSQSYFARNARHYYDALSDTNAFDALANSMHQAASYRDQRYVTEKILDLGSDLSNPVANTLQTAFGSLSGLPEARALSPHLDDIRLFFAQATNTVLLQSATALISDAVKAAIKNGDTGPVDKLVVALLVHAEMLQSAPAAAQAMNVAVKSRADFETWINILSLPAVGWIGGTPPVPALETNCPTNVGVWINAGTPLAVPLVPCRLTASMAGDIITGFMQHINMQTEPELLSHSLAEFHKELSYANVSFRKLILDPQYQTVAFNDGFFVKDAHAVIPLATRLGQLFVKSGKKGIKNFKALLTNKTNARVDSVVLFGTIGYLLDRLETDCTNAITNCKPLEKQGNIESEIESKIFKVMTNVIVRGKLTEPRLNSDGQLSCKFTSDTHGAIFELLMTAYYHAKYEGLLPGGSDEDQVVDLERVLEIKMASGEKPNEGAKLHSFKRKTDIVLAGDGSQKGVKLIELKSLQAHPARTDVANATSKVRRKFPSWTTRGKKTTYHRQFLTDRVATYADDEGNTIGVGGISQKQAADFQWLLQSWKVPKTKPKRERDPGVSVTDAKCGAGKNCINEIKEKLTGRPLVKKDDFVKYNWPDMTNTLKYNSKIKEFNVGQILLDIFPDFPPEVKELQEALDEAELIIEDLEQQAAELERQAAEVGSRIDEFLRSVPGYEDLKRKTKEAAEKIGEKIDDANEKLGELVDQIPDTLVCDN